MEKRKLKQLRSIILMLTLGNLAVSSYAKSSPVPGIDESASIHKTWIQISAFTDIPLANADVAVYDRAGRLLVKAKHATNNQGFFPAHISAPPANLRVTVTWDASRESDLSRLPLGRFTLSSEVENFDPVHGVVYVNPVTTLVSLLVEHSKGRLTLEQARARVRHFLGIPPYASLGVALRHGKSFRSWYFSQVTFLKEAEKYGGVEPFIKVLLSDLATQPEITHAFPPASLSAGSILFSIAKELGKGALSWGAGQGCGWVAQTYGLIPAPDAATLEAIGNLQTGLQDLQSSVKQLSDQLANVEKQIIQKLNENEYYTVATGAADIASDVNTYEQDLTYYAAACPPLLDSSTPPDDNQVAYCTGKKQTVLSDLDKANGLYEKLSGKVLDNPAIGLKGTIHLFSLSLAESRVFFRPADSTLVQNAMGYWDDALTQAANLKVEKLHLINAQVTNPAELTDFLGDQNADPPVDAIFQQTHNAEVQTAFPVVPVNTVVDTRTRLMWDTLPLPIATAQSCIEGNPVPAPYSPQISYYSWNGFPDWTSPSIQDLQSLVDGGGSDPMGWLIAQTKAVAPDSPQSGGFPDIVNEPQKYNCTDRSTVWSRDPAPTPPGSPQLYYVFDFKNGAAEAANKSNWLWLRRAVDGKKQEQYYWYQ